MQIVHCLSSTFLQHLGNVGEQKYLLHVATLINCSREEWRLQTLWFQRLTWLNCLTHSLSDFLNAFNDRFERKYRSGCKHFITELVGCAYFLKLSPPGVQFGINSRMHADFLTEINRRCNGFAMLVESKGKLRTSYITA